MYDLFDKKTIEELNALQSIFHGTNSVSVDRFEKVKFDTKQRPDNYFGYTVNRHWRQFLLSLYYADVLSYPHPQDQVDFPRLFYLVNAFPQGFTLWQAAVQNKSCPVGYSGWYYVEKSTFDHVARMQYDTGITITNRFFLPAKEKTPYLYLFNYSITPALNHSQYSHTLMENYRAELSATKYSGLFCATVSDDGVRIAKRFAMNKIGSIRAQDGSPSDAVYLCLR